MLLFEIFNKVESNKMHFDILCLCFGTYILKALPKKRNGNYLPWHTESKSVTLCCGYPGYPVTPGNGFRRQRIHKMWYYIVDSYAI